MEKANEMKKRPPNQKKFSAKTLIDLYKTVIKEWDDIKKQLYEQTITGEKLVMKIGLLRHKSEAEIRSQIVLMYEPYTRDGERPILEIREKMQFDRFDYAVQNGTDVSEEELRAFKGIITDLKLRVPTVMNSNEPLEPHTFIQSVKQELQRRTHEMKVDKIKANEADWTNVVRDCHLHARYLDWVKFVGFKVVLINPMCLQELEFLRESATVIKDVFECLESTEALKLLRSVVGVFLPLYKQKHKAVLANPVWEDKDWVTSSNLLISFNLKIQSIVAIWKRDKEKYPKIKPLGVEWLRLIVSNSRVFKECFERFSNDQIFEDHLQSFAANDPVQSVRSSSLMLVRNFVMQMLSTDFENVSKMKERILYMAQHETDEESLKSYNVVCLSWESIVRDVIDPQGWIHQKDKEFLERIRTVHFGDEKLAQRNNYITIGYVKNYGDEKSEGKDQIEVLAHNEFEQLMDRLLLFMTGESESINSEALTTNKGISLMTAQDVYNLFLSFEKQLITAGLKDVGEGLRQLRERNITGKKLISLASDSKGNDILKEMFNSDISEDNPLKQEI
ncbi:hypothetical protein RFI_15503, partial [Reticulomyxa filosa]